MYIQLHFMKTIQWKVHGFKIRHIWDQTLSLLFHDLVTLGKVTLPFSSSVYFSEK